MKSSILRAGVVTLACALGLSACGGGDGDLYLYGKVYGVTKDGLVLKNGSSEVAVTSATSYGTFQFNDRVSTDDSFDIQVKSLPSNIVGCSVINGKARANYYTIAQISVTCETKKHDFSVAVRGLTSSGLVIINGSDRREVAPGATSVPMSQVYEDGPYGVSILNQPDTPTKQTCTVSGGTNGQGAGIMGTTNLVGNVVITCV
jgi:hypothetical protein